MYFRKKTSGGRAYLQIVESRRDGGQVRQQVIATLGRYEDLRESGQLERLLRSGARFSCKAMVVDAVHDGSATVSEVRRLGPALAFERLWEETGCRAVIEELAGERKHEFALERAVFLTVLHRLFAGGSDRAADRWRDDYRIDGVEGLDLHHLYRAMAWLGEELPGDEQDGRTLAPRCLKDVMEERLFAKRRDLFSKLDLVFMDTTSLYFEGAGGQTLGRHGFSKDHRPDLHQMILAVLLDGDARPVCTEMWPGNTADRNGSCRPPDRAERPVECGRNTSTGLTITRKDHLIMAEMKTSISQSQAARRCPASSPHRGRGNQASAIGPLRKWRSGRRSRGHVFRSAPCGQIPALAGRTMTTAAEPIAGRSYPADSVSSPCGLMAGWCGRVTTRETDCVAGVIGLEL